MYLNTAKEEHLPGVQTAPVTDHPLVNAILLCGRESSKLHQPFLHHCFLSYLYFTGHFCVAGYVYLLFLQITSEHVNRLRAAVIWSSLPPARWNGRQNSTRWVEKTLKMA